MVAMAVAVCMHHSSVELMDELHVTIEIAAVLGAILRHIWSETGIFLVVPHLHRRELGLHVFGFNCAAVGYAVFAGDWCVICVRSRQVWHQALCCISFCMLMLMPSPLLNQARARLVTCILQTNAVAPLVSSSLDH